MSSFHPVLGLLAVAVCISYAKGAPVSAIQKDDVTSQKLHNLHFPISSLIGRNNDPLPSALYNENNEIKNKYEKQLANVLAEKNYESIPQEARSRTLNDLGSKHDNGVLSETRYRQSGSESVAKEVVEGGRISSNEQYYSFRGISGGSRKSEELYSSSAVGGGLERSEPEEEDCEEEDETGPTTPSLTTTTNEEPGPTDEDCDSEEGSSGSTESPESTSESTASPATDNSVATARTRTTQRTTKTRDPNRSSGSFHDDDSVGVDFSDSVSAESKGRSTEFREDFTN